jgi:hypothetical protein
MKNDVLEQLANKSITREQLAEQVKADFELLPEILKGVSSPQPHVRYGCAKILMIISEEQPEKLYPHMDFFVHLLNSEYRILTWSALAVLANLTTVDTKNKFDTIFDKYYRFLNDEYMVTVANVVGHSSKIAKAKPQLTEKITKELLKVEKIHTTPHLTPECKNVIVQKTITSLGTYFNQIQNKEDVISFVKRQRTNTRKTARMEAERFLKKWNQPQ